jgi:hypothetical protein
VALRDSERVRPESEDGIEAAQRTILYELISSYPAQLTEEELALVVGHPTDTHDALRELESAGLVHTRDEFFWATRPAYHFAQLGYEQ